MVLPNQGRCVNEFVACSLDVLNLSGEVSLKAQGCEHFFSQCILMIYQNAISKGTKINYYVDCIDTAIFYSLKCICDVNDSLNVREVNNRLTGWAFAHPVNSFAHPVNSTRPLLKTAHPGNYLSHSKWAAQFFLNQAIYKDFAKTTNLEHTFKRMFVISFSVHLPELADSGIKRTYLNVYREEHIIWVRSLKN